MVPSIILALVAGVVPTFVANPLPVSAVGGQIQPPPTVAPPANLSTSGDYATDNFGDPWDFSNAEDVLPYADAGFGSVPQSGINLSNGVLTTQMTYGDSIRFVMEWPGVLPWGRDGRARPIDGSRYTRATMMVQTDATVTLAFRFWTEQATVGLAYVTVQGGGGYQQITVDMLDRSRYLNGTANIAWAGDIVRFELVREPTPGVGDGPVNVRLDWVRLHRADAPVAPPSRLPISRVLTPNEQGGSDYASDVRGNPWDFAGMDDVESLVQFANARIENGDLVGTTTGNDPSILLPMGGATLNGNKYHRLTVDICFESGGFGLYDAPGGGMNGRFYWGGGSVPDASSFVSRPFIVFPGCQLITLELSTVPGIEVSEVTTAGSSWTSAQHFRFDFDEDPGARNIRLRSIKIADDAAFTNSYPITFDDAAAAAGTTADIYVSTARGDFNGTKIASVPVASGANTFNWTGTDVAGNMMANGTYWVYVAIRNAAGISTNMASGPLRMQKPIPNTPSYFVPLSPARILDTRTGVGGYAAPLGAGAIASLDVTGVGGVPETGVTAVVMNVTVDAPWTAGFLTAWPSAEPRPLVSNLNFVAGQTVPNLVTVKISSNGKVDLFNSGASTHVIADIAGYYTPIPVAAGRFTAVSPARLLDTRDGTGRAGAVGPIGSGQTVDLAVTGVGGVPSTGVSSVALNVTVDQPTGSGYLTVSPSGEPRPTASTHNFTAGMTVANMVIAKVGAGGKVSIFNFAGDSHVVADVVGYFSAQGGLFVPMAPERLVDTRTSVGTTTMGQADLKSLPVATGNPVPTSVRAVVVNVTSVNSTLPSFVTVWPSGLPMPLASTLNPRPGVPVPNQAYLLVGGGGLDAFNASGTTDLIVDAFGYIID
ncbi:MAG: hypothetical protein ABIR32_21090 [Ilumatobacteraceae bacterium]